MQGTPNKAKYRGCITVNSKALIAGQKRQACKDVSLRAF